MSKLFNGANCLVNATHIVSALAKDHLLRYIDDLDAGRIELTTERADLEKERSQKIAEKQVC